MIVENDLQNLGDIQFYEVPLNSTTKLIGPTAVREALDKDPEFAELKTLLRNPRIGDNILYRVGEHDVYFIPVYTAGAGGVVAQLGTIAAVGAAFTGEYYVGLGDTQEEAFEAYLKKVSGVAGSSTSVDVDYIELGKLDRINIIKSSFKENGIEISDTARATTGRARCRTCCARCSGEKAASDATASSCWRRISTTSCRSTSTT